MTADGLAPAGARPSVAMVLIIGKMGLYIQRLSTWYSLVSWNYHIFFPQNNSAYQGLICIKAACYVAI